MKEAMVVALSGALGALARYQTNLWAARTFPGGIYYGTFFVNVAGCFCLGLLLQYADQTGFPSRIVRLGIGVGFFGAFTTFSTFGYETVSAAGRGAMGLAMTIVAANLIVGLAAVWAGIVLARMIAQS